VLLLLVFALLLLVLPLLLQTVPLLRALAAPRLRLAWLLPLRRTHLWRLLLVLLPVLSESLPLSKCNEIGSRPCTLLYLKSNKCSGGWDRMA
jgi:hypothetical protein